MEIKLIAPKVSFVKLQVAAITALCELEGVKIDFIDQSQDRLFKEYYKGANPAILIYQNLRLKAILYGFWDFAEYVQRNHLMYC